MLDRYIQDVHKKWSSIFHERVASLVDAESVTLVEGLMPQASTKDNEHIVQLIKSQTLFPLVSGSERAELVNRLSTIAGRITSINTLVQDTLFLDGPAKALHRLCPPKFKGSVTVAMRRQWNSMGNSQAFEVQVSEREFLTRQSVAFEVCMIQLWLFAIRHSVQNIRGPKGNQPFRWSTHISSAYGLAVLAQKLGFSSSTILELQSEGLNYQMARGFLGTVCDDEFYQLEGHALEEMSNGFKNALGSLQNRCDDTNFAPHFMTNDPSEKAQHRFNSPSYQQFHTQRPHLFLEKIFKEPSTSGIFPTSFGITRDIILCFFGEGLVRWVAENEVSQPGPSSHGGEIQQENDLPNMALVTQELTGIPDPIDPPLPQDGDNTIPDPTGSSPEYESDGMLIEHPSGTPDNGLTDFETPLAAGFEDKRHIGPLNHKTAIAHNRGLGEILKLWYQSQNTTLVVLFLVESREYFKIPVQESLTLRTRLKDLSNDHVFYIYDNEYGFTNPGLQDLPDQAMRNRLVFVFRRDRPREWKPEYGEDPRLEIEQYLESFNVHTGKRKLDTGEGPRPRPRPLG